MLIYDSNSKKTLSLINDDLRQRNLKTLPTLGGNTEDEPKVIGVVEILDHMSEYLTDVIYAVRYPSGETRDHIVHYHAGSRLHDGVVAITLINGKLAIVKQFRIPTMKWTHEIPRGFANVNELSVGNSVTEPVMRRLLQRELGKRLLRQAEITELQSLAVVDSDPGFSAMALEYVFVQLEATQSEIERRLHTPEYGIELYLWNQNTLQREVCRKLRDAFSLTAVELLRAKTDWLS